MSNTFRATVTVMGVPSVPTEEEFERIQAHIMGAVRHEAATGQLTMVWRFEGHRMGMAVEWAKHAWRAAVSEIAIANPVCTDFHVQQVPPEEDDEVVTDLVKAPEVAAKDGEKAAGK